MTTIAAIFGTFLLMGFVLMAFLINPWAVTLIGLAILICMIFPVQVMMIVGIIVGAIALAYAISEYS